MKEEKENRMKAAVFSGPLSLTLMNVENPYQAVVRF